MELEWYCTTEEQKARICEKHQKAKRSKCILTVIKVAVFGTIILILLLISHYFSVRDACADILGYYPGFPPKYRGSFLYYEMERNERSKEEFLAKQNVKIVQTYAEVMPDVLKEYLPFYVLWFLVVVGIIGGRVLCSYNQMKRFQAEPLYYCMMRVVGKTTYRARYSSSHKLTLKTANGMLMEDVNSDCFDELEIDCMAMLIKTQSTYNTYDAVLPASILEGTVR